MEQTENLPIIQKFIDMSQLHVYIYSHRVKPGSMWVLWKEKLDTL